MQGQKGGKGNNKSGNQQKPQQVKKANTQASPVQNEVDSKIQYPKLNDGKKEENKPLVNVDAKKETKPACGKCDDKTCSKCPCKKAGETKCVKQTQKKQEKKGKCKGRSIVSIIISLLLLIIVSVLQALFFISESRSSPGNKFFASIKGFFLSHPDAFKWLKFGTVLSTLSEFFVVIIAILGTASMVLSGTLRLLFRILSFLIVPLTLSASMFIIMTYLPDIMPSRVRFITSKLPKLPSCVQEKLDPIMRYLSSAEFQEFIGKKAQRFIRLFGAK